MAGTAAAVATAAVLAAGALLKFEEDRAFNNGPDYIKDGMPVGLPNKIGQAIARQACRRYADDPGSLEPDAAISYETVCRPYLDNIGYGGQPEIKKPFDGGQCPRRYRVSYSGRVPTGVQGGTNCVGAVDFSGFTDVWGPVGPLRVTSPGCATGAEGPAPFRGFTSWGPAGQARLSAPTTTTLGGRSYSMAITGVQILDPVPDDCGDPPPIYTDPEPPGTPGPDTEPYNPGPDIDINIDLDVNLDGSINVDIGTGPIIFNPFGGDNNIGGPGGGAGGPAPGDLGAPGPPGETTAGGDLFGNAPTGSVLVGVQIEILQAPIFAKEFDVGVFRGVCYIYMGAGALLDHDPAGAMLRTGQFVFAEKDNLTTWRVRATVGYNLRVTPYYRQVEEE